MSKRSQIILVALALLPVMAGCQSFRSAAGLDKPPPDEFAVLTKAPLIIPPDYNLKPPSPGAAPINQQEPTEAAQAAMFGAADAGASGVAGNFTPGERTLLANAGVQNADSSIRAELQSDEKAMQGSDASFTDKILGTPGEDHGQPINADAEAGRAKTTPTKPSDSATIQKSRSGGWFDWF